MAKAWQFSLKNPCTVCQTAVFLHCKNKHTMNADLILSSNLSKSEKARRLHSLGWSIKKIAETVGITYGTAWVAINKRTATITQIITAFTIDMVFSRKFGVEIEAYGVSQPVLKKALEQAGINVQVAGRGTQLTNTWKVTSDSSISGGNAFEIVSPILEGEEGLRQLRKVSEVLIGCRAQINKSCGLHIHFDAHNLSIGGWRNLYKNYIRLENVIDSMMPQSRRSNSNKYCNSLRKHSEIEHKIDRCRTVSNIANLYGSRYYKVNAQSYSIHNTVEFRQHSGTIEIEKMENWIRFLDSLVKYSHYGVVENGDFEALNKFCSPRLVDYIYGRIQSLNS